MRHETKVISSNHLSHSLCGHVKKKKKKKSMSFLFYFIANMISNFIYTTWKIVYSK
jgi:hypothetical protein